MHEHNTALPVSRGAQARGAGITAPLRAAPATRRDHLDAASREDTPASRSGRMAIPPPVARHKGGDHRTRARTWHNLPLADQVRELPYGELAVRLCVSAMPATARRDHPSAARAWARSYLSRTGTEAEGRVIWPLRRRHVLAHDLAHHYLGFAARHGRPNPVVSAGGTR